MENSQKNITYVHRFDLQSILYTIAKMLDMQIPCHFHRCSLTIERNCIKLHSLAHILQSNNHHQHEHHCQHWNEFLPKIAESPIVLCSKI